MLVVIGKFSVESEPPRFEPQPATYILLHLSTKKAVGEMSGVPFPVPKTVDLKTSERSFEKTDIKWPPLI